MTTSAVILFEYIFINHLNQYTTTAILEGSGEGITYFPMTENTCFYQTQLNW